ncbi:MAG: type I DNA topoisomerase [Paludibacteraceae bacterium]|nr:type I DNA topoisomerase [Paludibacteraceae bacterium]
MSKNLVIVESPSKAKTIEKFLDKDFKVMSSKGHIRDIEGDKSQHDSLGIDLKNNYQPHYVIEPDKTHLVAELKSEAKKADTVWLASDEDREGEAIAWHLAEVLKLDPKSTKRIVFHEITKNAILEAVANPRTIDLNLVNAQQARRVLDRIVGFELSPVLWRKVKPKLSAGRVQSVAVRLIVEKEREINDFKPESSYRVVGIFTGDDANGQNTTIKAELNHRFQTESEAREFLEQCTKTQFSISNIQTTPSKRHPAPPFTTSTLQQEAARKLGFPVATTMRIAQSLYEEGHITYMRTDSVNLSSLALGTAKTEITENYGPQYHQFRQFHTNTAGAQEAHEAIRPTYLNQHTAGKDVREQRLYDLIWKRTIASQMSDAEMEKTTITISSKQQEYQFVAQGEVVTFEGFLKVYLEGKDDEPQDTETTLLPQFALNTNVEANEIIADQRYSQAPYRFTEASLVKKLEELGIGRPSTYAATISTIQQRGYVEKGDKTGEKRNYQTLTLKRGKITSKTQHETYGAEKGKLLPTDVGMVVTDFLKQYFADIVNYNFTAEAEKDFDQIAEGKERWTEVVDKFYQSFHPQVSTASTEAPVSRGERYLGDDPETGLPIYVKIGRFGLIAQKGTTDGDKPLFASLKKNQTLENITLEEALELFRLPRNLGEFEGTDITIGEGRFGPYILHNKKYVSIPKAISPLEITKEEAIELIEEKRKSELPIHEFGDGEEKVLVLNGRYGPYISYQSNNYKIDKKLDVKELTEEKCREIIAKEKPAAKKTTRKTTKKK